VRRLDVVALSLSCTIPAGAQELRGRIVGTVRDTSGGVVPGVSVTLAGAPLLAPQGHRGAVADAEFLGPGARGGQAEAEADNAAQRRPGAGASCVPQKLTA
jgi:hypothetical protein